MMINQPEVALGIEGARRATEIPSEPRQTELTVKPFDGVYTESAAADRSAQGKPTPPDPEVTEQATRRRYSEQYKLAILTKADACKQSGEIGALLRREGLYSSQLATWRRQRQESVLTALKDKKRGRKGGGNEPLIQENKRLLKETHRLTKRLQRAELIIDIQKKVSEALGMPLETQGLDEDD
jgi:transposase